MSDVNDKVAKAIRHFWRTRSHQAKRQGTKSGQRDAGSRGAVTGGKHLDGFIALCRDLLVDAGLPGACVFWKNRLELPGFYRAEKNWDLVAVVEDQLLAVIEFKGQVGPSFGNNFNNRTEEALGNAIDLWAAYREGAFRQSQRPWLGFAFLLEDCPRSTAPVKVKQPHYAVFPEFVGASYAKRYELMLTRLLRERLYDGASLLMTPAKGGLKGEFHCPSEELSFRAFATSLYSHAHAFASLRDTQ